MQQRIKTDRNNKNNEEENGRDVYNGEILTKERRKGVAGNNNKERQKDGWIGVVQCIIG